MCSPEHNGNRVPRDDVGTFKLQDECLVFKASLGAQTAAWVLKQQPGCLLVPSLSLEGILAGQSNHPPAPPSIMTALKHLGTCCLPVRRGKLDSERALDFPH